MWEIPLTEESLTNNKVLEASKMTKTVFVDTSSCPDSKVHVFEPVRIPAFPKISVFHCNALLQVLLIYIYIYIYTYIA